MTHRNRYDEDRYEQDRDDERRYEGRYEGGRSMPDAPRGPGGAHRVRDGRLREDDPRAHDPYDADERRIDAEARHAAMARRAASRRFGGLDVPASIGGALAAIGLTVVLGSIAASATWLGYGADVTHPSTDLTVGALIVGGVTILISFLVGGWVAGRMARYDGGLTGLLTAGWFVAVMLVAAAVGAMTDTGYDALRTVQAPGWLVENASTAGGVAVMIGALVLMFVAAFLGGLIGQRYHRRADDLIAVTGALHGAHERNGTFGAAGRDETIDLRDRTRDDRLEVTDPADAAADADRTWSPRRVPETASASASTRDVAYTAGAPRQREDLDRDDLDRDGMTRDGMTRDGMARDGLAQDDLGREGLGVSGSGVADWSTPQAPGGTNRAFGPQAGEPRFKS